MDRVFFCTHLIFLCHICTAAYSGVYYGYVYAAGFCVLIFWGLVFSYSRHLVSRHEGIYCGAYSGVYCDCDDERTSGDIYAELLKRLV